MSLHEVRHDRNISSLLLSHREILHCVQNDKENENENLSKL